RHRGRPLREDLFRAPNAPKPPRGQEGIDEPAGDNGVHPRRWQRRYRWGKRKRIALVDSEPWQRLLDFLYPSVRHLGVRYVQPLELPESFQVLQPLVRHRSRGKRQQIKVIEFLEFLHSLIRHPGPGEVKLLEALEFCYRVQACVRYPGGIEVQLSES